MKIIKLSSDTINNYDYQKLILFLKKKSYLNQSKITRKFENNFSKFIGKKYSIFVNSGSSANLLIAQSLKESNFLKNRIVVLPSVSWATTVSPFLQLGYKIIICDSDKENLGLDLDHLKKICKNFKPGLVVTVNVLGHPNNYDKILEIKKKYKFKLIEDNCESLGSFFKKKKLGSIGFASSHSFYYGHHISTIEGGMVSTNDYNLYNIALSMRSHGWSRDLNKHIKKKLEKKYKVSKFSSLYKFYYSGFNIRSTDFNATLGINQLKKIDQISKIRYKNFQLYKKYLYNYWHQKSNSTLISSFGYVTFVKNRDKVFDVLSNNNIESRPVIAGNIAKQPFLKNKYLNNKDKFPNADFVDKHGLYLPNHKYLTKNEIKFVCNCLISVAEPIFF